MGKSRQDEDGLSFEKRADENPEDAQRFQVFGHGGLGASSLQGLSQHWIPRMKP
jgi:hypothetical protein